MFNLGFRKNKSGSPEGRTSKGRLPTKVKVGGVALLLLAGAGVGDHWYAHKEGVEEGRRDGTALGKKACQSSLSFDRLAPVDSLTVTKKQASLMIKHALNPFTAAHTDVDELGTTGYYQLQQDLAVKQPRVVAIEVPYAEAEPFPSIRDMKRLLADGTLLGALVRSQIAGDEEPFVSVIPVSAKQAYPDNPMTFIVSQQECN